MTDKLKALLDRARNVEMSAAEFSQQRRSFVYGNTHIENELITREMIAQAEKTVEAEKK